MFTSRFVDNTFLFHTKETCFLKVNRKFSLRVCSVFGMFGRFTAHSYSSDYSVIAEHSAEVTFSKKIIIWVQPLPNLLSYVILYTGLLNGNIPCMSIK